MEAASGNTYHIGILNPQTDVCIPDIVAKFAIHYQEPQPPRI